MLEISVNITSANAKVKTDISVVPGNKDKPNPFPKNNRISFSPRLLDLLKSEPKKDLKQNSERRACDFFLKLDYATSLNKKHLQPSKIETDEISFVI